jgi:hypothetical protein
LVADGVPTRKLTASQKINAKRVRDGLPETDKFTPAEAKAVLKDKFGLLIRRPETLRTAIYKTQKVVNKKTKKEVEKKKAEPVKKDKKSKKKVESSSDSDSDSSDAKPAKKRSRADSASKGSDNKAQKKTEKAVVP